jgi:hypothetical protein
MFINEGAIGQAVGVGVGEGETATVMPCIARVRPEVGVVAEEGEGCMTNGECSVLSFVM